MEQIQFETINNHKIATFFRNANSKNKVAKELAGFFGRKHIRQIS